MLALFVAVSVYAQTQTVWDDTSVAPWNDGYSYGTDVNVANTNPVHSGTKSISFIAHGDYSNGVSIAIPFASGDVSTATYPVLHFYVHGGPTGGQQIGIRIARTDNALEDPLISLFTGSVSDFIAGNTIVANTWNEVTVDLAANVGAAVSFDRIDFYTGNGADQPVVYFDDITLTQAGPPPAIPPMSALHDVSAPATSPAGEQMTSDVITWYDSNGNPRKATLAHDAKLVGGAHGVAMREFQYKLSNGATRVADYTTYGNGGFGGFGYVTDHSSRYAGCAGGDDSPLGLEFALSGYQIVWEGRHHAIYRMTQNYHRNCPTDLTVTPYAIPVTYDWIFSTGRDSIVYALTHNVDQMFRISDGAPVVGPNHFYDDTRAPYGELNIDGDGFSNAISGVAWGDYYKFTTDPAVVSLTMNTNWTWLGTNSIPFITEWIKSGDVNHDAEMGLVQTQTNAQQDAAGARDPGIGSDIRTLWDNQSGPPPAIPVGCAALNTKMPCANDWPYQALGNSLEYEWQNVVNNPAQTTNNARLTWKTQYGFIGQKYDPAAADPSQTGYALNDQKNGSSGRGNGYPKKSHSVFIVLGEHSVNPNPVDEQIAYVDAIQSTTVSAATGSVVLSGPAGVTRADNVTYQPAGYNHVYAALAFNAASNQLDANIAIGNAKTLKNPMIIIGNYTGGAPTVRLNGTLLVADADFFASTRTLPNELWLTLNRNLSGGMNRVQVNTAAAACTPFGAPTDVMAAVISETSVGITWMPVCNADSYIVERESLKANGFNTQIGTPNTTMATDNTAVGGNAYLYRVRAKQGVTESANSASVLATTVLFTDPNLSNQPIKREHLIQLRTAVSAVHFLSGLGSIATWPNDNTITAGTTKVSGAHVTDLRTKLDEAMTQLSLTTGGWTDGTLNNTVSVKAVHFQEIRNRVN